MTRPVRVAIVLFTRDLRLHDHPALACAAQSAHAVAPLFVLDPTVLRGFGAANRVSFLLAALRDLRRELRERGGSLVVRAGDVEARQPVRGAATHWLPSQWEHGAHAMGGPATQAPAWHESPTVQPSPSLHTLPLGRAEHRPDVPSQTSHAPHFCAPLQTPAVQTSATVQRS